jgi:aminoglycoside 6'-N-acetyltransferase
MRDGDLELRAFQAADAPVLEAIFEQPAVKRWWPIGDYIRDSGWTIEIDGIVRGWLEHHEETYEWYPSVAFDIALDSSVHSHGYGRRALALAIEHFAARGHHRFTVDPSAENERAIRCYESLHFKRVGIMHAYERNAAGGWNDGLMMDLVRLSET